MTDTYCVIAKLKLEDIPEAKTLKQAWFGGLPYAVSKNCEEGKLYAVFIPDGQLSEEYAVANNCVTRIDPETKKNVGGFFGKNRKVRTINLMQGKIRSVGYVADLSSLAFTGYDVTSLNEGDSFNELNGVPICKKFVVERKTSSNRTVIGRRKPNKVPTIIGLNEHPDTNQFYKFAKHIPAGAICSITLKLDGTSVRVGKVYEKQMYGRFFRAINRFVRLSSLLKQYNEVALTGSRRVVFHGKTKKINAGYYGTNDIYERVGESLFHKLVLGESFYGEIVGYSPGGKPLFDRAGVIFKYGCTVGDTDFYVYNITWTLPNGEKRDLPWSEVKSRCEELHIKHVVEMVPSFIYDGNIESLEKLVYSLVDGPDPIDSSHIREGVVLRVETGRETRWYKAKSEAYYALEDKAKESGQIDIEEDQNNTDDVVSI